MTTVYHLGYRDFRSPMLARPATADIVRERAHACHPQSDRGRLHQVEEVAVADGGSLGELGPGDPQRGVHLGSRRAGPLRDLRRADPERGQLCDYPDPLGRG